MKTFRKIKSIVWFFLILTAVDVVMYTLVVDDTGIPGRYILHHFYARKDNIDTLFLGTSHTMYGIDPDIYEEITGNKAYNCGTNWQYINGSFALLKEADRLYDLKHVYVDLYFFVCRMPNRDELTSEQLKSTYYISDFMKPSLNKYSYIFTGSNASHYIEGLVPQRRYIKNITDLAYVKSIIEKKMGMNYQNYILESEHEQIRENGHMACESSLKNQGFYYEGIYNPIYDIPEDWSDWKECLVDMIHYCEQHEITLTFMALPMSDFYIMQAGGAKYDSFIQEIKEIITSCRGTVDYIDFNLAKEIYLNLQEEDFRDISHLNSTGARKTTELLSNLELGENKEQALYESYQQKIMSDNKIFGVTLKVDEEKKLVTIEPVANVDRTQITCEVVSQTGDVDMKDGETVSFQYEAGGEYVIRSYIDGKLYNTVRYGGR